MIGELGNHLWQSTLFAVVAGLLSVALRKNRAHVRFWLWFAASVKFFVPFVLLMGLGSFLHWAPAQKMAAPVVAQGISFVMEQIAEPFGEVVPVAVAARDSVDWVPIAIFGVWACGLAGVGLMRLRGWRRIRGTVRSSVAMDVSAGVAVRSAAGLLEPGVVGVVRPILLLPEGIAERLTPLQLEAVVRHELCHVRRRDNLFAAIHMMVEATFWFHPLVWWIGTRLVEERERACDEEVLRLGSEPQVYAEGILNVCKLYVESPLQCVSGVTGSDLKKRIEAIMTNRVVFRLNFAKRVALAVAAMAAVAVPIVLGMLNAPRARAQAPAAGTPKFEVVSIRPGCDGNSGGGGVMTKTGGGRAQSPGRLNRCNTVAGFIGDAYLNFADGVTNRVLQMRLSGPSSSGGPAWIHSDIYQIIAKAEGTASQEMMRGPMMQVLLAERFKLQVHRESREVPVYVLTLAKGGAKLQPFQEGSCTPIDRTKAPAPPPATGPKNCMFQFGNKKGANLLLDAQGTNLTDFGNLLAFGFERPVIDKTGIAGKFDFHLEFSPDEATPKFLPGADGDGGPAAPGDAASDPVGPSLFTAIQQLGLKLEPSKGSKEFLVIDHVERPTGN
jgi:bla regulator protein BlaR1